MAVCFAICTTECSVVDVARGAILFSESFNYANGELQSASGGLWELHSGAGGQTIVNGALEIDDNGTGDYSRHLGSSAPITAGAVYAGFDVTMSTVDGPSGSSDSLPYFAHFGQNQSGTGFVSRLLANVGATSGTFKFGLLRAGGTPAGTTYWPVDLPLGVTHRVVLAYDLELQTSALWVNPNSVASASIDNASGSTLPTSGLNWFALRIAGTADGDKTIDNLIVATTFAESLGVTSVPGDFNGDGNVDGADFVIWQTNFPNNSGQATLAMGDGNGDGNVDGADFVMWQTNFPRNAAFSAYVVPEPAIGRLAWAVAGMLGWVFRRSLRRQPRSAVCDCPT